MDNDALGDVNVICNLGERLVGKACQLTMEKYNRVNFEYAKRKCFYGFYISRYGLFVDRIAEIGKLRGQL